MPMLRTAAVSLAAAGGLLATAGLAVADSGSGSPQSAAASHAASHAPHAAPTGDGARVLCQRAPRIDQRITRALTRLHGDATVPGSIARLQKRVDNAGAAGHDEIKKFLDGRLTFRKSLVPTLEQRQKDVRGVEKWCAARDNGSGS
ncbi:hypothetical protein [Streptomyces sp. bgisy154]|uniref:hypothetical protein n=1 Tax=Streptomyces sp. bgisy154 TaxID=3413794 RepID=UPI003D7273BD